MAIDLDQRQLCPNCHHRLQVRLWIWITPGEDVDVGEIDWETDRSGSDSWWCETCQVHLLPVDSGPAPDPDGEMIPPDIDLLRVTWGQDVGLVSLKRQQVLFYCYGHVEGQFLAPGTATIDLCDDDFALVVDPDESTWCHVPVLLSHQNFPLIGRIRQTNGEEN